jgi:hypothetical protein
MITTKLFIGTGIVFLSFLAFENKYKVIYISIDTKASKHSSTQPPGKEIYTDFVSNVMALMAKAVEKNPAS